MKNKLLSKMTFDDALKIITDTQRSSARLNIARNLDKQLSGTKAVLKYIASSNDHSARNKIKIQVEGQIEKFFIFKEEVNRKISSKTDRASDQALSKIEKYRQEVNNRFDTVISNLQDVVAADFEESLPEVAFDQRLLNLAAKLNYDPLKIYNHVSNEIAYQKYYESMKGVLGTLLNGSGSATDQGIASCCLVACVKNTRQHSMYLLGISS
jgi:hypothetical protein